MRKRTLVKSLEAAEVLRRAEDLKRGEHETEQKSTARYLLGHGSHSAGFAQADLPSGEAPVAEVAQKRLVFYEGRMTFGTEFYKWLCSTRKKPDDLRDLTLTEFDDAGVPVASWKIKKAFPLKISGLQLKARGNEVAVAVVEITYHMLEPGDFPPSVH